MNKRCSIIILLAMILAIGGIAVESKTVYCKSLGGEIIDPDGNVWESWTPDGGYVVNPEYADELANWRENFDGSTDQYYVVNGHEPAYNNTNSTTPVAPATPAPNREFEQLDSLPVGDDYSNACIELKKKDEKKFDEYLEYQQNKSLTCEHDYIEVAKGAATCVDHGFISRECSKCHNLETDDIAPLAHKLKVIEEKAATCTEDGYKKSVCTACGEEIIEDEVKAFGHTEVADDAEATLFKPGHHIVTCSTCGEELVNESTPQIIPVWAIVVGCIVILVAGVLVGYFVKKNNK